MFNRVSLPKVPPIPLLNSPYLAPPPPQGFFRIIKNQGGGGTPPPKPPPPLRLKVAIVGKSETYNRENLVRPFLVHQVLGPKPPPPPPHPNSKLRDLGKGFVWTLLAPAWEGRQGAEAALVSRGTIVPLSPRKIHFPGLLGEAEQAAHLSQFSESALPPPPFDGWATTPPIHAWRIPP